jgi:hypothetical protein
MAFEKWYVDQFRETLNTPLSPQDGMSDAEIESLLRGQAIPSAMRDYYRVAGRHWINNSYNELLRPDALEDVDGYLVFMNENQCVVRWGIRNADQTADDPTVFQGQEINDVCNWYSEDLCFSQFMIATWNWVLTGEGDW